MFKKLWRRIFSPPTVSPFIGDNKESLSRLVAKLNRTDEDKERWEKQDREGMIRVANAIREAEEEPLVVRDFSMHAVHMVKDPIYDQAKINDQNDPSIG